MPYYHGPLLILSGWSNFNLSTMESAFAKETFRAWFESNLPLLARFVHSKDVDAKDGRAAWASVHMPTHTVGISAWDHENKLEIIMIDTSTDESKVEEKKYSSPEKLQARLDTLLQQLIGMCD